MPESQSAHQDCLALLRQHGGVWYVGCDWNWRDSATATAMLLRTLERRGEVERWITPKRVEWRLPDVNRKRSAPPLVSRVDLSDRLMARRHPAWRS